MRLRWVLEEDGTRRLQFADTCTTYGRKNFWNWQDVPEVSVAEEWSEMKHGAPEQDK